MGGGEVLNSSGRALPKVEAVAHLQGIRGAGDDALPVGEGSVAAGDLNTWVLTDWTDASGIEGLVVKNMNQRY
ncbi:hypothetical protein [Streptomyces chryseus]